MIQDVMLHAQKLRECMDFFTQDARQAGECERQRTAARRAHARSG
jgi:hypothetical protein